MEERDPTRAAEESETIEDIEGHKFRSGLTEDEESTEDESAEVEGHKFRSGLDESEEEDVEGHRRI